jgi:hypothetical protein
MPVMVIIVRATLGKSHLLEAHITYDHPKPNSLHILLSENRCRESDDHTLNIAFRLFIHSELPKHFLHIHHYKKTIIVAGFIAAVPN